MSDHSHDNHHVNYRLIFIVLVVCSILSFVFDKISLTPKVTLVLVLAVACTKAMCVMMYFMHLKFEKLLLILALLIPVFYAVALVIGLLPDLFYGNFGAGV